MTDREKLEFLINSWCVMSGDESYTDGALIDVFHELVHKIKSEVQRDDQ